MFAIEHGYELLGEVRGFPEHFMFRKLQHDQGLESRSLTFSLLDDIRYRISINFDSDSINPKLIILKLVEMSWI